MAIIESNALCSAETTKVVTHPVNQIGLNLSKFGDGQVVINGVDVSDVVSAEIALTNDSRTGPVLTVRVLGAVEAAAEGRVEVDAATAQALEALGWTPPTAAARGGRR